MEKNLLWSALWIGIILAGLLSAGAMHFETVHASNSVIGILTSDTTWTKANSPYIFTGPVGIAKDVTLTIDPGVTVNIGLFYLEVNGTLNAQGTPTDKIVFNSNDQINGPPLNENNFFPSANARQNIFLAYDNPLCKIENSILNQTSIDGESSISNATLMINGCFFEGNSKINVWGSTTISNSYITGAVLLRGASIVSDSTFLNGIDIAGGCSGSSFSGTYAVSGNNITNKQGIYVMNVGDAGIISGNIIWGGTVAGICQADGFPAMSATIERNLIINNQFGILMRKNDDSTIQYNTITNNKVGIAYPTPLQTITCNNIQGNSQYNMQASQTNATAKNNWWGTNDQQSISQTIYDSKDDFNLGTANFVPYLTAPNPDAPAITMNPAFIPSLSPEPSSSPSTSTSPSLNSTSPEPTEPAEQTGNQALTELEIQEIVIAVLVVLIVVLLIILVRMQKRSRTEKKNMG